MIYLLANDGRGRFEIHTCLAIILSTEPLFGPARPAGAPTCAKCVLGSYTPSYGLPQS
jgi:hypothetical protein